MLNWFLDLGLGVFIDICAFTIVILGVFMVIKKSYAFMLMNTKHSKSQACLRI